MVTLNTAQGDGGLRLGVNVVGSFGSFFADEETSDAFYDPVGSLLEAGTVFESFVAFRVLDDESDTSTPRTILTPERSAFSSSSSTEAVSEFSLEGLDFELEQNVVDIVEDGTRTGSNLIQTYRITNPGTESVDFEFVRYVDGDLEFDGSIDDAGGRFFRNGQEILFETDSGENAQFSTTFFGITASGGNADTPGRYEVNEFSTLQANILTGETLQDLVEGDGDDEDQFIDESAYDLALALRNDFSLEPGASATYRTTTTFGSGIPEEVGISSAPLPLPGAILGSTNNDPRIVTFDGLLYGFQAVGEFVLLESDDRDLEIQVRQEEIGTNVSANTAIATSVDDVRVGIYATDEPILIDGVPTEIADNNSISVGENGGIFRDGDEYTLVYGNGEQIVANVRSGSRVDIDLLLAENRQDAISGLLGNSNGDTNDDLSLRDGDVLEQPVAFETLYGDFADSWRIDQADSLFDYESGENTETITNLDFPTSAVTIDDLDATLRADAEQQVIDAGIAEDSPLFEPTVIDLALTQDTTIIDTAISTETPESVLEVTAPVEEVDEPSEEETPDPPIEEVDEPSEEETPDPPVEEVDEPTLSANESTAFRFFSSNADYNFYTTDEAEIEHVTENLGNYEAEGAAYRVLDTLSGDEADSTDIENVYRFFNPNSGSHLYTTNEVERDFIVDNLGNYNFEGAKFAAYNRDLGEQTIPVYRFYNPTTGVHTYTESEAEQESLASSGDYNAEGIAFYAVDLDFE